VAGFLAGAKDLIASRPPVVHFSRLRSKYPPFASASEAPGLVPPAEGKRMIQSKLKVDFAVYRKRVGEVHTRKKSKQQGTQLMQILIMDWM
jgi:hypothetical protein